MNVKQQHGWKISQSLHEPPQVQGKQLESQKERDKQRVREGAGKEQDGEGGIKPPVFLPKL